MRTKTTVPPKKVVKKAAKKPVPKKAAPRKTNVKPWQFDIGNKAAEKWTEESVLEVLNEMLSHLSKGKKGNIVQANRIKLAGEIRLMCGVTKQRWSEWREKFKENANVSDRMAMIEEILECRLVYSGSNMDIFVLKNHYGYKDKTEVDNTTTLKGSIDISKWLRKNSE